MSPAGIVHDSALGVANVAAGYSTVRDKNRIAVQLMVDGVPETLSSLCLTRLQNGLGLQISGPALH